MTPCQVLYLMQVRVRMRNCPQPARSQLLKGLAQEIQEFVQYMPRCTMGDLIEVFQTPQQAANQLLEAVPVAQQLAVQRQKWVILSGTLLLLSATVIGNLMLQLHMAQERNPFIIREKVYVYRDHVDEIPVGAQSIVETVQKTPFYLF